ncbi:hypothetical protein DPMN_039606 [Dreissena polymorpha]|uniref:Uncharacterized protein n=1 Tax=Dreissena polymorpha TaxID=45954 RepID=A0A9D4HW19_DREPO|nr:hypothetical protein DPMN_039606 [Dreissena polymorpha]
MTSSTSPTHVVSQDLLVVEEKPSMSRSCGRTGSHQQIVGWRKTLSWGMSLIYRRNNKGPRTDHWGTLDVTGEEVED